ncbi:MAG: caspase family protein [Endomicrobiales bacterium]|nr:caspase family protein [Endomicrobiales bacterium]
MIKKAIYLIITILILVLSSFAAAKQDYKLKILEDHAQLVRSVSFSKDGKYLASGSFDNSVKLWHVKSGTCMNTFKGHTGGVWSVVFSPDSKYLASGSEDNTIKLWSVETGECVKTFQGHTGWVHAVCFSPDGKYIASGSADKSLRIWSVDTGKCIRSFRLVVGWVLSIAISPNGEYIASGGMSNIVKVWRISDGYLVRTFKGHLDYVNSVSFSSEGNYLLSGSDDKTIKVWSLDSGECIKTLKNGSGQVYSVSMAPYGKCVVSGSSDQQIRIWSLVTGECLEEFDNGSSYVYSAAFSHDGKYIATGGGDKKITLWKNPLDKYVYTTKDEAGLFSSTGKVLTRLPVMTRVEVMAQKGNSLYVKVGKTLKGWISADNISFEKPDLMKPAVEIYEKHFEEPYLYIKGVAYDDKKISSVKIGNMELLRKKFSFNKADNVYTDAYPFESKIMITPETELVLKVTDTSAKSIDIPFNIREPVVDYTPKYVYLKAKKDASIAEKPDKSSNKVASVKEEAILIAIGEKGSWYYLEGGGWIAKNVVEEKQSRTYQEMIEELALVLDAKSAGSEIVSYQSEINEDIPKGKVNPDAVAVVIGVQEYTNESVPRVKYALNDAYMVKQYLVKTLGYREGNIIFAENPTKADFERIFGTRDNHKGQLFNYIKSGKSDVFIYYTGHGAPGVNSKATYFVPSDCHSNYVELSGYSLDQFYYNISKLPAKNMTVVLDACFSGNSESGTLVKGASPLAMVYRSKIPKGINVFTGCSDTELTSWYPEKQHSLFTYFFLKGLHGDANTDSNDVLTFKELEDYVIAEVSYLARRLYGREQTPKLIGKSSNVITEYIHEDSKSSLSKMEINNSSAR